MENLAVVNYDTNNLYLAPYDWRLSYYNLEERDGYFSKLKSTIELLRYILYQMIILILTPSPCQETSKEENCRCCTLYGMYCALQLLCLSSEYLILVQGSSGVSG